MEASVESIAGGLVCKFDGGILFTAFGAMIITIQFMFNLYGPNSSFMKRTIRGRVVRTQNSTV